MSVCGAVVGPDAPQLRAERVWEDEDLMHDLVVHIIANYLGLEPEVVDPGFGGSDPGEP